MEARTMSLPPAASHDDAEWCFFAIELSKKSWIVAVNTPLSDKISRYRLKACDRKELLKLIERIRTRVAGELKKRVDVVSRAPPWKPSETEEPALQRCSMARLLSLGALLSPSTPRA